jgi:hypothetical protein
MSTSGDLTVENVSDLLTTPLQSPPLATKSSAGWGKPLLFTVETLEVPWEPSPIFSDVGLAEELKSPMLKYCCDGVRVGLMKTSPSTHIDPDAKRLLY